MTIRICCAVTLDIELYSLLDGPDARLAEEAARLQKANERNKQAAADKPIDANIDNSIVSRPLYVIRNLLPLSFSFCANSFREADTFECKLPLSALPVPLAAIRNATLYASIQHISDVDWAAGVRPVVTKDQQDADFVGIVQEATQSVTKDNIPVVTLKCIDFVGALSNKKVEPGIEIDPNLPLDKAIAKFLQNTMAQEIPVVWKEPNEKAPTLGKYKPKLHRKPKTPKAKAPKSSQDTYLQAIEKACSMVGVVPRVTGPRIELSYAGTMYQGLDRGETQCTIIVGSVVESIQVEHEYVGPKYQTVLVTSWDPDKHVQYSAQWPPNPKNKQAKKLDKNERPMGDLVKVMLGRPGRETLDDSVLIVPVEPVSNPELLPKVAEAIFFERNRQRSKIVVKTHSPFSKPFDNEYPDILKLRAGDTVRFGYVEELAGLGPEVRALTGALGQSLLQKIFESQGFENAAKIAAAVSLVPHTDAFRVDSLVVECSEDSEPEIEIHLVNYTVITSDLQAKADNRSVDEALKSVYDKASSLATMAKSEIRKFFDELRKEILKSSQDPNPDLAKIAALEKSMLRLSWQELLLL